MWQSFRKKSKIVDGKQQLKSDFNIESIYISYKKYVRTFLVDSVLIKSMDYVGKINRVVIINTK